MFEEVKDLPARSATPVSEFIVTRCDKAASLSVKGVANYEFGVAAVALFVEVWGL